MSDDSKKFSLVQPRTTADWRTKPNPMDFNIHRRLEEVIAGANYYDLHATITLTLTQDDGSVVTVTKQSARALRGCR